MVKDIKINRIKTKFNKIISTLSIKHGKHIIWITVHELKLIASYYIREKYIIFDLTDLYASYDIKYDTEECNIVKELLTDKIYELFSEYPIEIIKFI